MILSGVTVIDGLPYVRRSTKPRARWNPYGTGYWTVRHTYLGIVFQGVGATLTEAYDSWLGVCAKHSV